jgi:hypothetical protein
MRQTSESPGPRDPPASATRGDQEYPFVNQSFMSADQAALYMGGGTGKTLKGGASGRSYNYRTRGGPKRPPNAYMMCVPHLFLFFFFFFSLFCMVCGN